MTTTDRFGMTVLATNECLDLLRSNVVGRLAICTADHPDIVEDARPQPAMVAP